MVAIHLHWPSKKMTVEIETLDDLRLVSPLTECYRKLMSSESSCPGFAFERHARLYVDHPTDRGPVPTVLILKPDQRRHWTRSQALRDGDEIAMEILRMKWTKRSE